MDEEQILRRILIKVVNEEPRLTAHGLGVYDEQRLLREKREEEFRRGREDLFKLTNGFKQACMWLSLQERTKNINPKGGTSYALKHAVERWGRKMFGHKSSGVPNGSFIAAAIHLGFKYKPIGESSPNVYLNISRNKVKGEIF